MRWPFSMQDREPTLPPVDAQRWSVAQTQLGGAALLVRANDTARDWCGHRGLSVKLGFAVPLNRPNDGGLPDAEENEQLGAIEDLIVARVLAARGGIHALTLTTGLMKEFVFYVPSGLDIARLHDGIRSAVASHTVQCIAVDEPGWDTYRELTS